MDENQGRKGPSGVSIGIAVAVIVFAFLVWRVESLNAKLRRVETDLWTVYGLETAHMQSLVPIKVEIDSAYARASRAVKVTPDSYPPFTGVRPPPPPPCPPFCPPGDPLGALQRGAKYLEALRGSTENPRRP